MKLHPTALLVTGGVSYLAARHIFEKSQTVSVGTGLLAATALLLLLNGKLPVPVQATENALSRESPTLPETDFSGANPHPETYPPLNFSTGRPVNTSPQAQLESLTIEPYDEA